MCLICDRIRMIKRGENPWFVRELSTGYVVIGDHQRFYGYTLFLYRRHEGATELFHLAPDERARFMDEMALVAQAVSETFGAQKMNYELLGMGDAHLHWHLFPRREGDIGERGNRGKGPVWLVPFEEMYSDDNRPNDETLSDMRRRLGAAIDRLLASTDA